MTYDKMTAQQKLDLNLKKLDIYKKLYADRIEAYNYSVFNMEYVEEQMTKFKREILFGNPKKYYNPYSRELIAFVYYLENELFNAIADGNKQRMWEYTIYLSRVLKAKGDYDYLCRVE